jgi:hypothetical protein
MTFESTASTAVHSLYAYPQPTGLCALREYLLTDSEEGRILLLRWVKEGDFGIDSMTFEVTMLDSMGNELGRVTVTQKDGDIPPVEAGHVFTPDRGVPVDGGCVDIRVKLLEVRSGSYVYRVENGTVIIDYDAPEPWRYDPRAGEKERLTEEKPLRVRSKRAGKVRFLWPVALLTVFALVYILIIRFHLL